MAPDGCLCFARISGNSHRVASSKANGTESREYSRCSTSADFLSDPVVLSGSILRDFVAPPWHLISTCQGPIDSPLWEDPKGRPALTAKQKRRLGGWVRLFDDGAPKPVFFKAVPSSSRIKQGFVADCSFLSSLATLADYEKKYSTPLLTNIIRFVMIGDDHASKFALFRPSDDTTPEREIPKVAIGVKLYFNGVSRCVIVDDWVPIRSDGRMLSAHSVDRDECWVTLLEKAFVKLNGGCYTIRGTNPGIDTYHLTGWIPDIITLPQSRSNNINAIGSDERLSEKWNHIWDVMYAGFCSGSCVVCLGTSEIADATPAGDDGPEGISVSSGIVSNHAYSVLDIKDVLMPDKTQLRMMYLKNPWGIVSWTKRFSPGDTVSWTKEMCTVLDYQPNTSKDNGLFWIEWNDVLRWFSHIYISWKPNVFRNRITLHQRWHYEPRFSASLVMDDMHLSVFNPQFNLSISFENHNSATVWLLLLQHRHSSEEPLKYMAMHVFSREEVVVCPPLPDLQGVYSNGECILAKLLVKRTPSRDAPSKHMLTGEVIKPYTSGENTGVLVLLSCYAEKITQDVPFTIRALSSRPVELTPLPCLVKPHWYTTEIHGEWTEENCGGGPNDVWSYFMNPHYKLTFADIGEALILLESSTPLSVNLRLFPGRIATPRLLKSTSVISSDDYTVNCCSVHRFFQSGHYVIIPSTFRPNEKGSFRIVVYSRYPCSLKPMPYPQCPMDSAPNIYTRRIDMNDVIHFDVKVPTALSIRIEVPPDVMSDFFAIFASSAGVSHPSQKEVACNFQAKDNHYCSSSTCTMCGGPCSRFRELLTNEHSPQSKTATYDLVLYSDLNGGSSKTGRSISAAARQLFETKRVINFTMVELLPSKVPYKLTALGGASMGLVTFTSDHPLSIV
ncbi:calpain family cysteine protease domain-containing protein [Babesia ovis]|uniref:Calpain family cysteine protease domain-containing protein n=1 Tax=Babesia ovis TaxID=5869 RepID=A0A9W5WTZ4_BABOV|nr:calpain family cysteine protease domain-containing protein [Babesia ovis]